MSLLKLQNFTTSVILHMFVYHDVPRTKISTTNTHERLAPKNVTKIMIYNYNDYKKV